jgi:hypothetical protein
MNTVNNNVSNTNWNGVGGGNPYYGGGGYNKWWGFEYE